jgi:hypothetical protein
VVEMVTVLEMCTTEEQNLLWARGLNAKDIHREMCPVYGGKCLSCKMVHDLVEKVSQE